MYTCRICDGTVVEFFDFGRQPISDAFVEPDEVGSEFFFQLAVGRCQSCTMVQLLEEVPRERMFRPDYPYRSSESSLISKHFERVARTLLDTELTGPDPFVVEIGSNDGVMLKTLSQAGVRHLGVDPSTSAAAVASGLGVRVYPDYFDENSAEKIRTANGLADAIFSANTTSHISYIDSVLRGVNLLLAEDGAFIFEERYLVDIISKNSFDQIYDEHFYLFAVGSVRSMAERFGFQLSDVEHLPVHGGTIRYTITRPGTRKISQRVEEFLDNEAAIGLGSVEMFKGFGDKVRNTRTELMQLLTTLRAEGKRVVGYGATAKSATIINYCGITDELVEVVYDSTVAKQGKLTPGSHIPVRPPAEFGNPYPEYALLFAWNHADEIMAKEKAFRDAGGKWILYAPDVHIV